MTRSVRPDFIWDRSSLLIERAGRHSHGFLIGVRRRLVGSRLPGLEVGHEPLRFGGWFTPAYPAVILRLERLGDVHTYVRARAAGVHLEVLVLTAVEPGWLKRSSASLFARGAWWSWSLPHAVTGQEELRTFLTLVDTTVRVAARNLAARLAPTGRVLPAERGTALDEWH